MKISKATRKNLAAVSDIIRSDSSVVWLTAAASILETIAEDIRRELAAQTQSAAATSSTSH